MFDYKRVSHSGLQTFNECNYKGYLQYILKMEPDFDVEEKDYFIYGTDLHNILNKQIKFYIKEETFLSIPFEEAIKDFQIKDPLKQLKIYFSHLIFIEHMNKLFTHFPSAKFLCTEQQIQTEYTTLIIDTILEIEGQWFIVDFKTTGKIDYNLPAKLHKEPQLLHYACHKHIINKIVKDRTNTTFGGIMFWQFIKTSHKISKANDTLEKVFNHLKSEYLENNGKFIRYLLCYENELDFNSYWNEYQKSYDNIQFICKQDPKDIMRNYSHCINSYGNRCPFWSSCYDGKTFTECKKDSKESHNLIELFSREENLF